MQIRVVYSAPNSAVCGTKDAAFLDWLNSQEGQPSVAPAQTARIAVVGHTFKPIPANLEAAELQHAATAASHSAPTQDAGQPIVTPSFVNVTSAQGQGECCCNA